MTNTTRRRAAASVLALFAFTLALSLDCRAQQATPTPGPAEQLPGTQIADTLAQIAVKTKDIVDNVGGTVVEAYSGTIYYIAASIFTLLTGATLFKLMMNDNGNPFHLLYWLARIIIFTTLLVNAQEIFNGFEQAKADVLQTFKSHAGPGGGDASPLELARLRFDESYKRFTKLHFQELKGTDLNTAEKQTGKLWDPSKPWQHNLDRAIDPNAWNAPNLFAVLTISRGLLSFCDFAVEVMYGLVKIGIVLFSVLMIAVGLDKELAREVTYMYLRGVIVFYLIWPPVADIIRCIFYLTTSVTLEAFDTPVIQRIQGTTAVGNPVIQESILSAFDGYAVVAGCVLMLVSCLFVILSPMLAYRFSKGQVFEAISTAASNWVGAIAGQAAELYGARVSAEVEQMARMTELQGGRDAASAGAEGSYKAAELNARAQQLTGTTQAHIGLEQTSAGLSAENQRANTLLNNENRAQIERLSTGANATAMRSEVQTNYTKATNTASAYKEEKTVAVGRDFEQRKLIGNGATSTASQVVTGVGNSMAGNGAGNVAAAPLEVVRTVGLNKLSQMEGDKKQAVISETLGYSNQFADQQNQNNIYVAGWEANRNAETQNNLTGGQWQANNAYNVTMQGVAQSVYGQSVDLSHAVYGLNVDAAKAHYDSEIRSAGITFAAGERAAELHKKAAIISAATRDIDRTLQDAMSLNY